jgi:hypothetical protein
VRLFQTAQQFTNTRIGSSNRLHSRHTTQKAYAEEKLEELVADSIHLQESRWLNLKSKPAAQYAL